MTSRSLDQLIRVSVGIHPLSLFHARSQNLATAHCRTYQLLVNQFLGVNQIKLHTTDIFCVWVQSSSQRRWAKKIQSEWSILEKNLPGKPQNVSHFISSNHSIHSM